MDSPSDAVVDVYERKASAWDEDRQYARPPGERQWIERFLALAQPGTRILDLGCGSGAPIIPDLLEAGHTVTGIDASTSLIALCRQRFPDQAWIAVDMRKISLGCRFGGILAWHSLFHLPPDDQRQMFPVLVRHMLPGAPLMFTSGSEQGVSVGAWRGEPLYPASLDTAEYQTLLETNGLRVAGHVVDDARCGGASIWLARREEV